MNEVIMISSHTPKKGLDVVLMDYFNDTGRVYTDVPAKIAFTVSDPAGVSQAISAEGMEIIQMPSAGVRGVAKDSLGYEVELIEDRL